MTPYIFVFGRTPELSFAEVSTILSSAKYIHPSVSLAESDSDPETLIHRLGGTVKIAKYIETVEFVTPKLLAQVIQNEISGPSITFGLSIYAQAKSPIDIRKITSDIKDLLGNSGSHVRYVLPKDGQELSSVVVGKNFVCELLLVQVTDGWMIGRTVAVQPFAEWSKRDFDRPAVDPHAGMLPPKVARMAVNISGKTGIHDGNTLLVDPFCGVGTILAEGLMTGFSVYGLDISEDQLEKSNKNLEWLCDSYHVRELFPKDARVWRTARSDATHLSDVLYADSIDVIVTEPYLGNVRFGDEKKRKSVTADEVKNMIRGLDKLYLGCLKEWHPLLKDDGVIVIAFPAIIHGRTEYRVKKTIDSCETLGYTKLLGPLAYHRPQAIVKREFFVLKKHFLEKQV